MKINSYTLDTAISNYHWMVEELDKERAAVAYKGASTAQYGIEATMPKASGISDPVGREAVHRMSRIRLIDLEEYEQQVNTIEELSLKITDQRERFVLAKLLQGESMAQIAKTLKVAHTTIKRIREQIVDNMLK